MQTSETLMLAVDIAKRMRLAARIDEAIRKGPQGSLGEGIKVCLGPQIQNDFKVNPFAVVTVENDTKVIHAGPQHFTRPYDVYPSTIGTSAIDMVERMKEGKKIDPIRFFSEKPPSRHIEKSPVYQMLPVYEELLARYFGDKLVLVNPSTATLFNMAGRVGRFTLRFGEEKKQKKDRTVYAEGIRSKAVYIGGYEEVYGTSPDLLYYYGSNGMKYFEDVNGFALTPNPFGECYKNDPTFTTTTTSTGVETSYERKGVLRVNFLSIYPVVNRYSPEEVDNFLGTAHGAFFIESYHAFIPTRMRLPYSPTGPRFYLPLTDDDNIYGHFHRDASEVYVVRGAVVDFEGPGTWMGRWRERFKYANEKGLGSIDYSPHGSYYVCLNSLSVEREAMACSVHFNSTVIGPNDGENVIFPRKIPDGFKAHSVSKGWAWRLGYNSGLESSMLPGGSAYPIDWLGVTGNLTTDWYLSEECATDTYTWFFFSQRDFDHYCLDLSFQLSRVHSIPNQVYVDKVKVYDDSIVEWCAENTSTPQTLDMLMKVFPSCTKSFIKMVLSDGDWVVPDDKAKDQTIKYRRSPKFSHSVLEIIDVLRYYRSVIVKSKEPLPSFVQRKLTKYQYKIGPFYPIATSEGFTTIISTGLSRDPRTKIVYYYPFDIGPALEPYSDPI